MLSESDLAVLKSLSESDDKLVKVAGDRAFIGEDVFSSARVSRLAAMTAVREMGTEDGITTYELTATGRQLLVDPEYQNQITTALFGY